MRASLASFLLLLVVCAGCPALAGTEPVALPVELDCAGKRIELDLHESQLEVLYDGESKPHLTVVDLLRPENEDGLVMIDDGSAVLQVSQPHGGERSAPKLLVKLRLAPGTPLAVRGENLTVSIELFGAPEIGDVPIADLDGTLGAEPAEPAAQPATAPAASLVSLELRNSSAHVVGLGVTLRGIGTVFTVERAQGQLRADLDGGRLLVEGLAGSLDVRSENAQIELGRVLGSVEHNLTSSVLVLNEGSGTLHGLGTGTDVRVSRWAGAVGLTGSGGRTEVSETGGPGVTIQLSQTGGETQLEHVRGTIVLDQKGGTVALRTINGDVSVSTRAAADVKAERVKGRLDLQLSENSNAIVHGAERGFSARTDGGRLEVAGVRDTMLNVTSGSVSAKELTGHADIRARDADLELDLSGVTSTLKFDLAGTTRAKATLTEPCFVLLDGSNEVDDRLTVSGCDTQEQRRRGTAPQRYGGTRAPVIASTKLADGATLDVIAH